MGWVFPTKTPHTQLRIARLESLAEARDACFDGCDKDAAKIALQLVNTSEELKFDYPTTLFKNLNSATTNQIWPGPLPQNRKHPIK